MTVPAKLGLAPTAGQSNGNPSHNQAQPRLRNFRAKDLQAVRDLFRTAVDTGRASVRREALRRQRFDAINLTLYFLVAVGGFSWYWYSNIPRYGLFPFSISSIGGVLAFGAITTFAYRRRMVSRAYMMHLQRSMDSSDLRDIVGHYHLKPVNTPGDEVGGDVDLASDGARAFWVVEVDGKIVGCAGFDILPDRPLCGEIHRMVVSPNHRRLGIGKLLLNKIMDRAREYKLETITLCTSAYQVPARRLYEKYGFVEERKWLLKGSRGIYAVYVHGYQYQL